MDNNSLKVIIQGVLDITTTTKTLDEQLKGLSNKLDSIKLKVEFDERTLSIFTKMGDNIEKITQRLTNQKVAMQNMVAQTNKENEALNQQTEAINKATEAQKKYNVEKQKITTAADNSYQTVSNTTGTKFNNTTTSTTTYANGEITEHPTVQNIDTAGLERAQLTEHNKMLDEAYKMNAEFDKKAEAIDKAHYQALKKNQEIYEKEFQDLVKQEEAIDKAHFQALQTEQARQEAIDKAHYQALKTNREMYIKDLTKLLKDAEAIDKAHYQALKTDREREEALDKQHYLALQQNAKRENDITDAKLALQTKIDNMQRRFGEGIDTKGLDDLRARVDQINGSTVNWQRNVKGISQDLDKFAANVKTSGSHVVDFSEAFQQAITKFPIWMAASTLFFQSLHFFTDGIKYVNDFNATLTQIGTATNYSQDKLAQLGKSFQQLSSDISASVSDVSSAALEFYRQGLGDDEVLKRLKTTTEYSRISGLQFTQSADLLTAASNSMKVDINQVADTFTLLGDKTATSASEIGIAFQKVGATAESLNVPFSKVAAMIATISSVTREAPETIGSAVKSIFSRVESVKEKGYDSTDGTTINQVATALHAASIELVGANGQFRNFSTVLDELGAKWSGLDDKTQRYIATTVAGTYQQSRFLALMNNYNQVLDLNNQALNSAGTTQSKYNIYLQGTQAHIDALKNKMQGLWTDTFDSKALQHIIDLLGTLITGFDKLVSTFGFAPVVVFAVTTALFSLNKTALTTFNNMLAKIPATRAELIALTSTLDASSLAVKGMSLAFAAMDVLLPVALITGLTFAISQFMGSATEAKQKTDDLANSFKQNASELESKISSLKKLSDEYESLQGKTNKTTEETDRLNQIEKDLVKTYGVSITGINAQGEAYANNTEVIKLRIKELEKQRQLEQDNLKNSVIANSDQTQDSVGKDLKNIEYYQQKITQTQNLVDNLKSSIANNGSIGVQLPSGIITKDLDYMKSLLPEYEKELGYWQTKNQEFYSNLSKDSANLLQVLTNDLDQNGKNLNDKAKLVGENLAKAFSQSNVPSQEVIEQFNNSLKSLSNDGFNSLVVKYDELSQELSKNPLDKDLKDQLNGVQASLGNSLDEIFKQFNFSSVQIKGLEDFKKEFMSMLNAVSEGKNTLLDTASIQKELNAAFESTTQAVQPLNDAIDKMHQGHSLTSGEVSNLLKKYPDLIQSFTDENGVLKIGVQALEDKRDAEVGAFNDTINLEQKKVDAQKTALSQRLTLYATEIEAIKSSAEAKQLELKVFQEAQDKFHEDGVQGPAFVPKSDLDTIDAIGKAQDSIKALQTVAQSGFKFENSINTPNTKPKQDTQAQLHEITDTTNLQIEAINSVTKARDEDIKSLQKQISTQDKAKDYNQVIKLTNDLLNSQNEKIKDINKANSALHDGAEAVRNMNDETVKLGKQFEEDGVLFDKWFNGDNTASQSYIDAIHDIDQFVKNIEGDGKNLTKNQQNQITQLENQKKLYENIFNQLVAFKKAHQDNENLLQQQKDTIDATKQSLEDTYQKLIDDAQKATDKVDKLNDSIKSTQEEMASQIRQYADNVVQIYKDAYDALKKGELENIKRQEDALSQRRQNEKNAHDDRIKELDSEMKKYQDLYDAQIKKIDEQSSEEDYQKKLSQLRTDQNQIQHDLDIANLNTDKENQKNREDLEKKLTEKLKEISDLKSQHDKDARKKSLQDALDTQKKELDGRKSSIQDQEDLQQKAYDNEKQRLDDLKTATTQHYDDLINDDRKYNAIREQILSGSFDAVLKDFDNFKTEVNSKSAVIGQILANSITDKITDMQSTLTQASSVMGDTWAQLGLKIQENVVTKLSDLKTKFDDLNNQKLTALNDQLSTTRDLLTAISQASSEWANKTEEGQQAAHDSVVNMRAQLDHDYGTTSKYDDATGIWTVTKNGEFIGDTSTSDSADRLTKWYQDNKNTLGYGNPYSSGSYPTQPSSSGSSASSQPQGAPPVINGQTLVWDDSDHAWHSPTHHDGTAGSEPTPLGKALHKMFNLNQHEEMAKILKSEPVINTAQFKMSTFANLMSAMKLPDFSGLKNGNTTNSNNVTVHLNIANMNGTKKDVDYVFTEIRKGFNSMGLSFN